MKKSDGTYVTVRLDSNCNAVGTVSGFGQGPAGGPGGPGGAPPPPSSGTSSTTAA
jgi:hypothetical protein